jgi:Methylamine utilisation protein MauE
MSVAHGLLFARMTIAVLFTASTFGKLASRRDFELAVEGFRLLGSRRSVSLAATAVIAAEALVVLLVAAGGSLLMPGFVLAAALLAVFSLVLGSALRRRLQVGCNCFGPGVRLISGMDVVRNLVMALCAVAGLVLMGLDRPRPLTAAEVALLAGMSVVFVLVVANLGDIAATLRAPL